MEFTRELVIKKINQIFPKKDLVRILDILDLYGVNQYEPVRERVQLAVLKLCEGKEDEVRKLIELAKIDHCEDVLWPAEEPFLSKIKRIDIIKMSEEEIKRIQEKDRKQYLGWLNS